jgi:endonuclease YncB( thermonuclease family)
MRSQRSIYSALVSVVLLVLVSACTLTVTLENSGGSPDSGGAGPGTGELTEGEGFTVTRVIDGDTIEVRNDATQVTYRVRYVGMNTPESNEPCFAEARSANANMVEGRQVRLVRDTSNTDRYGRLLRYVYVGDIFVNEVLVRDGWAEVVRYDPDDQYFEHFRTLEQYAAAAGAGCHPTGIFNDNTYTR